MEREEIERAVDALMALSRAEKADRDAVVAALDARIRAVEEDTDRAKRSHSLVIFMLNAIPVVALVRHLAVVKLRADDLPTWSHAEVGRLLEISRASAQEISRRSRSRLPKA